MEPPGPGGLIFRGHQGAKGTVRLTEALGRTVRSRVTRLAVVLAVAASVLIVAFGTGYRASQAVLDDGSAWLVKGRSVAHVNAETGRSDADVARDLGKGGEALEVVQTPSGHLYVVNDEVGSVTRVDLADMDPAETRSGTPGKLQVLGSGADTYYVDRGRGTVELVDPDTMSVRRRVPVDAGVSAAVADTGGRLWVLDGAGTLHRVVDGAVSEAIPTGGKAGDQKLTLVDGHPVLVDRARGTVRVVEGGELRELDAGLPRDARMEVNQPSTRGGVAWLADEGSGTLLGVDVARGANGDTRTISLGSSERADLGPAVALGGSVYVPDFTAHVVRVVDADDGRLARTIRVVGKSRTFDLFVEDGRLWINDPAARSARVLDANGKSTTIDKGTGHGVADPSNSPERRRPASPVSAPEQAGPAVSAPQTAGQQPAGAGPSRTTRPGTGATSRLPAAAQPAARQPKPKPPSPGGGTASPASDRVTVPDVVGQQRDDACTALADAGLGCSPQGVGSRPGVEPDEVVDTSPGPRSQVRKGTIVTVQYAGATTVPDLGGRTPQEACDQLLTPAGLECDPQPRGTAPDGQPVDRVNGQSPSPNEEVAGGASVSYDFYDKFRVADYRGANPQQACQSLASRPITCQPVDDGAGPRGTQPNTVQRQSLPPGDYAAGQTIQVHYYAVENGDAMPNVVGQPEAAACAQIQQAGYQCNPVEHPTPARQPGIALSQSHAAGSAAPMGTRVDVTRETNQASEICRFRRQDPGDQDVWVIRVGCGTSGVEGWERTSVGWSFAENQGQQGGSIPLFDNVCRCGDRLNHQITPGGYNGQSPPWQQNGSVGFAFDRDYGGMGELVRMVRPAAKSGNGADYTYAIRGSQAYNSYLNAQRPLRDEQSLGWVWLQ